MSEIEPPPQSINFVVFQPQILLQKGMNVIFKYENVRSYIYKRFTMDIEETPE